MRKPENSVFIITRFNIITNYSATSQNLLISDNENINLDKEYLDKRFKLFEEFYIPSILAQTDKDFKAIVLFHPDTSQEYKKLIAHYQEITNNCLIPVYTITDSMEPVKDIIRQNCKNSPWVITIRLDNDDALSIIQ